MHGREVPLDHVHTVRVVGAHAVVLLQVDRVLRHPEWVGHVGLHPLHPLHTLGAGEPGGNRGVTMDLQGQGVQSRNI